MFRKNFSVNNSHLGSKNSTFSSHFEKNAHFYLSDQNYFVLIVILWLTGLTRFHRDLASNEKVSYYCICDHMRNEPARLAGISLCSSEISPNRAEDFLM